MAAQRKHDLEVAAVAGHAAVELALVADAKIDRADLPADAEASQERALLLRRRDDVEVVLRIRGEPPVEARTLVAEAVAVAKVHFRNHAAHRRSPLDPAGEVAVVRLAASRS